MTINDKLKQERLAGNYPGSQPLNDIHRDALKLKFSIRAAYKNNRIAQQDILDVLKELNFDMTAQDVEKMCS